MPASYSTSCVPVPFPLRQAERDLQDLRDALVEIDGKMKQDGC
jgi:hypothetical protein